MGLAGPNEQVYEIVGKSYDLHELVQAIREGRQGQAEAIISRVWSLSPRCTIFRPRATTASPIRLRRFGDLRHDLGGVRRGVLFHRHVGQGNHTQNASLCIHHGDTP